VEGIDFTCGKVTAVWEPTLQEDKTLTENTQLGIDSTAYQPGPYMDTERFVADFDRWYLRRAASETSRV
jgi:Rieske 2Fe-2S family protein